MSKPTLRAEIEAQNAKFMDAARRADARAIASLYVEGA